MSHQSFIDLAAILALESTVMNKTGAVLVKNGRVFGEGASDWHRQTFGGQVLAMSGHAEIMAILSSSLRARRVLPTLLSIYGSPLQGQIQSRKQWKEWYKEEERFTFDRIHYLC